MQAVRKLRELISGKGLADQREADRQARLLACAAVKENLSELFVRAEQPLNEEEAARLETLLERRLQGMPLQYALGETEFYGLPFRVDARVLIPRPETELLVEAAIGFLQGRKEKRALDLCTGSGCIAVSIAKHTGDALVDASDISEDALDVARGNARQNGVDIRLFKSDLFEKVVGKYDLITANPPYIRQEEYAALSVEVRDYEPRGALLAPEEGLAFYRRISCQAGQYLRPDGALMLEMGYGQWEDIRALLAENGFEAEKIDDYQGIARVAIARRKDA